jgi:hypothetical protein
MFRRTLLLAAVILVFAVSVNAQEDETPGWTAWLHETNSGYITLVNGDGEARTITLPPEGEMGAMGVWGEWIAVAPSGEHIAYEADYQFYVYHAATNKSTFTSYSIFPQSPPFSSSWDGEMFAAAFDESASRLAAGFAFRPNEVKPWEIWDIAIIDYNTGEMVAVLSSADPAAAQLGWLPIIHRYSGDEITLLTQQFSAGYVEDFQVFTWNTATGEVTPSESLPMTANLLPTRAFNPPDGGPGLLSPPLHIHMLNTTGEVIRAIRDERLPAVSAPRPDFAYLYPNVLQAYDPASGATHVFYNDDTASVWGGTFIQNGERILVCTNTPDSLQWKLIERDGTLVAESRALTLSVYGTPDGFIFIEPRGTPALIHVNTRGGEFEPEIVWEAATDARHVLAHFILQAAPPESYTPWADLVSAEAGEMPGWLYEARPGCFGLV